MSETAAPQRSTVPSPRLHAADRLRRLIEHAAHFLPSQGPLSVFVHHNTLHAFEHLPFADALVEAARVYGCEIYLSEQRYRQKLARGRIRSEDLVAVLQDDLGERADELIGPLGARFNLRLAMLQTPLYSAPTNELRWVVAETEALRRFRADTPAAFRERTIDGTRRWVMRDFRKGHAETGDRGAAPEVVRIVRELLDSRGRRELESWRIDAWESFTLELLWRVCCWGAAQHDQPSPASPCLQRPRDLLLAATGQDSDDLVHEVLIRYCAAFLDQGLSQWPLPDRSLGFYSAFLQTGGTTRGILPAWRRELHREAERLAAERIAPLESIQESLAILGVHQDQYKDFITQTLLALRGWAGMIWQMETNAEWAVHPAPANSLVEFLAVRLVLDRLAVAHVARKHLDFRGPLEDLAATVNGSTASGAADAGVQRAFLIFQLAQARGWKPEELSHLTPAMWRMLLTEVDAFASVERRRVFHLAYERCYREQSLGAMAAFGRQGNPLRVDDGEPPLFQLITCLDDREESFRRHLEEVEPRCETLACAGFFGVAMYYQGVAEANSRPLCPVVVKPQHYVQELPALTFAEAHQRRARTRRVLGSASHTVHRGSRSLVVGVLTALAGSVASIPLVMRILFPRASAQIRRLLGRFVQPPPVTQLALERSAPDPGPDAGHIGYSVPEMAAIVERMLRDMGLTRNYSRLVIVCGHGSSSLNNPHGSAYDCGACGGGRGGPNARAFAQMANDPRVRALLRERGLVLPGDVYFVGALHNTCDDSVTYLDLDQLPPALTGLFRQAKQAIDVARQRNAHERCRRFESAPLSLTPEAALRHVEGRSEDMAQVRPECGHATNAVCMVGRRRRTRGMFLDRRWFLTSYDPDQDDVESTILTRVLGAAIPVCAGINLEYYFSYTDPVRLGCSTKLSHNITSLLGVMDGASSDLRPGLPWQMVEIHEPVRLLFLIETTPAAMERILDRNPPLAMLCRNEWVQLATLDPHSSDMHLLRGGKLEPYSPAADDLPEVASSADWYRGWRDHLGYAVVTS